MPPDTYRILQSGKEVATSSGEHGLREIMQQARFYAQDGPLAIQRHKGKRWERFGLIDD